ncbi:hypothetical protein [Alkaliphilus metalliredigens]|uniref:hypothetical protein n=1 Tax=Alkaliphilus metalliredigens TaxID=208226 RepID=UPI0005A14D06|nr:hypothetical protein [Alkaliphilus metalliredigens]
MKNKTILILTIIITYVITRIIYFKLGFDYNVYTESFAIGKFLVDVGIYTVVFMGAYQCITFYNKRYLSK